MLHDLGSEVVFWLLLASLPLPVPLHEGEDHIEFAFSHGVGVLALGRLPYLGYATGHSSLASVDGSRWSSLASSFLRPTSSLPQRSISTSSLWLNQGLCTTLGYVAFTEYEKIGDAMRIQNTVFDVNFVASEVVFQPLHSINATSLHGEGVNAVRVSRCRLRMVSVPQHYDHQTQQPQLRPPKSMKTLTLCESKADPRWKRVTEGRRPKDRSEKGGSLVSPGLASQRDRFLTAKQGRLLPINATPSRRPDAVGWAPLVGQAR